MLAVDVLVVDAGCFSGSSYYVYRFELLVFKLLLEMMA